MITQTASLLAAALLAGVAGQARAEPAGYAPELGERYGWVLFETLDAVACAPARVSDPLGGAHLERRLGAVVSPCARVKIASAAAAALDRGAAVRWRMGEAGLRGAALPGDAAPARLGACRTVRLETFTADGDVDERTLTFCRISGAWRASPDDRFSRAG